MALSPTAQIMSLGVIHLISCAIVYVLVGFAAKKLLSTRPYAVKIVSRISGGLMVMIGLILIVGQS